MAGASPAMTWGRRRDGGLPRVRMTMKIAMPLALGRHPRDIPAAFRECVIGVWSGLDDALPEILV
jgi:hypothetical protein